MTFLDQEEQDLLESVENKEWNSIDNLIVFLNPIHHDCLIQLLEQELVV